MLIVLDFLENIYSYPYERAILLALIAFACWTIFMLIMHRWPFVCKLLQIVFLCLTVYIILYFTVLGRAATYDHTFVFFAYRGSEFWREMFMNILLYIILGLVLPYVIKNVPLAILLGFAMSVAIESWQYFAGTGVSQGTDIICNTLGCVIGCFSYLIYTVICKSSENTKSH